MKRLLLLSYVIFHQFVSFAFSYTETTSAMQMCRTIEIALYDDFILPGKPLPWSFENMPFLRECAEHQWAESPHEFELLNDLVIVPSAPTIKKEQGISLNRAGSRLFAISRTWNFDYSKNGFDRSNPRDGGRFVILISENPLSVAPSWISEQEARITLNQIVGFDPAKQPRSFDDFEKNARTKVTEKEARVENTRKMGRNSTRPNLRTRNSSSTIFGNHGELWIIAAFMVLVLLILLAIRQRRRLQTGRKWSSEG